MIEKIIIYIVLATILLFPIVIWAYIFSYIDYNPINKKRFLSGFIGWILSVIPILYMDKILWTSNFEYINIFYYVSRISNIFSAIKFSFSLSLFLTLLVIFSFIFWCFIHKFKKILKIYFKNLLIFLIFTFFIWTILYIFHIFFNKIDFSLKNEIIFWDIIFNSFKLVVFYYLIVAFIEEASKYFNFLQSSILYIDNIKKWVMYAIFVALWFSFIENTIYLYNYYMEYWVSFELLKIYFFRSVFSVIVHILCSSVVAYYFSRAIILYRETNFSFSYLKIFLFGLIISIFLHLLFNIALTLWFSLIIFIYFVGWYLYVSSIFYKK